MCISPFYARKKLFIDENTGELKNKVVVKKNLNNFSLSHDDFIKLSIERPDEYFTLPCGKCPECLNHYSNEWAYRIMLEASLYEKNCFITLTYNNENCDDELHKKDLSLFIKRLRKSLEPIKIRYYACGEFGSKGLRPHYHLIVFNWFPEDAKFFKHSGKNQEMYVSDKLNKLWSNGYVSVGDVNYNTSKYCCKYMQKLQSNLYDDKLTKPFNTMSLKPGIGYNAFLNNKDEAIICDKIYHKGNYITLPRYFINRLERQFLVDFKDLRNAREKKRKLFLNNKDNLIYKKLKYKELYNYEVSVIE